MKETCRKEEPGEEEVKKMKKEKKGEEEVKEGRREKNRQRTGKKVQK